MGVQVSVLTMDVACRVIESWARNLRKALVCVAPVSTLVDCQQDTAYRDIINRADMVTPDGMPVVWLLKAKGYAPVERVYGPDLMSALCRRKGLRHFFFGGTPEVLSRLQERLKESFREIQIVGSIAPEFHPKAQVEDKQRVAEINLAKPDILWVGLGSPKQDYWMQAHRCLLDVPVMIGVGAAFDFLSGVKRQAPCWMQRSGL